jgi:Arc/MetJ-type ribon-helix-helix transcriptional regulator
MSESRQVETVELPVEVVVRIEDRVDRTEFDDASSYITHVLEDLLHEVDQSTETTNSDPVDEQQVEERLKSLGYLNE